MPRRSRRLNPPSALDGLSDDLILRLFARAPFMTHGTLHVVCRRLKTLLKSPEFLQQRVETGLAEHGIIVAGVTGNDYPMSADCWMLSEWRWRPIPPMSEPRRGACSVIIDNEMWVMGGDGDNSIDLATVEVYSPKTNSWRSCAPMSQRRFAAVAGVVGGRLVVAGGFCDGGLLSSVEAYTGTGWTPLPPMPHTGWYATACVLNGRLYVMGGLGSNKLQVLEMTEENGLSWSRKADLPAVRYAAASIVHEGKVWLMGGIVDGESSTTVLTYDADADTWEMAPPLPFPVAGGSATTMDGGIVLRCLSRAAAEHHILQYKDARWSGIQQRALFRAASGFGSVLLG